MKYYLPLSFLSIEFKLLPSRTWSILSWESIAHGILSTNKGHYCFKETISIEFEQWSSSSLLLVSLCFEFFARQLIANKISSIAITQLLWMGKYWSEIGLKIFIIKFYYQSIAPSYRTLIYLNNLHARVYQKRWLGALLCFSSPFGLHFGY